MTAYTQDLKTYLGWCQGFDREVLRVTRGELEVYVRHLEGRGYAAPTVARQFRTVATFYKYAVIDGIIPASPAAAVTRPKVAVRRPAAERAAPLEFAAVLAAARSDDAHRLVLSLFSVCSGCAFRSAPGPTLGTCGSRRVARCSTSRQGQPSPPTCRAALCARAGSRRRAHHRADLRARSGRRMDRAAPARP